MAMTARQVDAAKPKNKSYRISDEKSMYLEVTSKGAKYWRLKYRFAGKEKRLALGVYPETTLQEAREKRDDARKLLAKGIDPGSVRRAQKLSNAQAAENSFEAVAWEWLEIKMKGKSKGHRIRAARYIKRDLVPVFGKRPIDSIEPPELLAALRRVEKCGTVDTAHRVKQTAGAIFRYAIATSRANRDPSADLAGALETPEKGNFAAITDPDILGQLLLAVDVYRGTSTVKAALSLTALLFPRQVELRFMEWTEINWDEKIWEVPKERMKRRRPHIVPLSGQALEILKEQQLVSGRGKFVFPSARGASRALSENGVNVALRIMGFDNKTHTAHGFRATARTIMDEKLNIRVDLIEHQLSHEVKDTNGRAYNRTTFLEQRREMMQQWADYLDALREKALQRV